MKVIGLTSGLRAEAEKECRSEFTAWLAEIRMADWKSEAALRANYPGSFRMAEHEVYFPLKTGGTGIRAAVFYPLGLMRLLCLCPAPPAPAKPSSRRFPPVHPEGISQHEIPTNQ